MKKKVISFALVLVMVFSMLPITAFAEINKGDDLGYNNVISKKTYAISPGVTETNLTLNDDTASNQNLCYMMEVDLSNEHATVMPSYSNMDPTVYRQQAMSQQAAAAEEKLGVNVVGGVNVNLSWASDEPIGMLVVNGEVWHDDTSYEGCYLVIHQDNTAELRDGNVPLDGSEWQAVSANFGWLIKDGVNQYPDADHSNANRNPRTAMGIKADGTLVLFVVDGRQAPTSAGMTMNELAEAMEAAGCVDAVNCDGGGSSTFLSEREGTGELTVKNSPSDGVERPTLSGLLVISNAKPSGEFDHASVTPDGEYYTPGSEIPFQATGVDSAGAAAALPEDAVWSLAESSAALGAIDAATGVFTANADAVGEVTVNLSSGGNVVGSATIELVKPDEIYFATDEVSLGFEATTDFDVQVKYHDLDVNYKVGDLIWTLSDEALGTFDGNIFTSSDGESLTGTVTVTSAFDAAITDTLTLIVGMLPTVVWDFEDYTDPETGVVTSAEDYYCGANGILTHSNYNRGGNESIEIISIDDDEPVRMGSHALKLNYDFTNYSGGGNAEGACVGTTEGMEIPGAPTAIGVWVYAPEGVGITWEGDGTQSGFWLRGYVQDGLGNNQPYDFTLEPKAVTGDQQPGIYWEGWKYLEADLTKYTGPFSIQPGMTFRLMYVPPTMMGTMTAGAIYFDNLQFVYGTNMDDVDNPVIHSVQVNGAELEDGATLNANTFNITADVYDVENKYTSGVDPDTVRMYIDGINTYDNENYTYAVDPDGSRSYLSNLYLRDGQHSLTVSLRDKFGNETAQTYFFTVAGGETNTDPTVTVTSDPDVAVLGGQLNLKITASDAALVDHAAVSLKLDKNFPDYEITFSDDYEGTVSYSKINGQTTITADRREGASGAGNVIAEVAIQIPADLQEDAVLTYTVKSGSYTTSDGGYYTFSATEQSVDVAAAYTLSADPVIVGRSASVAVTDMNGEPAANVNICLEDGTQVGTTAANGILITDAFSETAGKTIIYAQDADGRLSFHYTVTSFNAVGEGTAPFAIKFNAAEEGTTGKNITWQTNPSQESKQVLQYAVSGSENWEEAAATTTLCTFVQGGYDAVNVHNVKLTGLAPDTTYSYRVGDGENWSETAEFTTGKDDGKTSFFVLGDIQAEDLTNINAIMDNLKAGSYDFGLQTGDGVDDASKYEDWTEMTSLFGQEKLGATDMIQVLGNHEFGGDAEGMVSKAIYGLPDSGMGSCYSVTYDNIYVAVINYTSTKAQLQAALDWLEEDAAKSDAKWKILTMHQPAYYTNISGGNAEIQAMVPEVVDRAGIDLVFSGHDHTYARTEPLTGGQVTKDGAVYFICGSSGEKSYSVTDNPDFHFAKATQDYNAVYLSVEADWNDITVTAYNVSADGSKVVLDSYTKGVERCENDEHDYLYHRDTERLVCQNCGYTNTAEAEMYSGWAHDSETGRLMYFVAGSYMTGYQYISSTSYYIDENGLCFEGEYTLCGETCLFKDGQYVSCGTADVTLAGMAGEKVEFVLYTDGTLKVGGSGNMYDYNTYGNVPWYPVCTSIKRIQIGADVTSIGVYAFHGATKCESVTFAEGSKLTAIKDNGFYYLSSLKKIQLPVGVKTLGNYAFGYCGLEKVYLCDGLTSMNSTAFGKCASLTDIYYEGSEEQWNEISGVEKAIPAQVTVHYLPSIARFTDVHASDWYAPYVEQAYQLGVMTGTSETTFDPKGTTTRAAFVQSLYAMEGKPAVSGVTPFKDLTDDWYQDAVLWAYQNKVTSGMSDTAFAPDTSVTREQIAVFLYAYAGRPAVSGDLSQFPDAGKVSSWARTAMIWAVQNGIISGSANDGKVYLYPRNTATRAETATMMVGFCRFMNP